MSESKTLSFEDFHSRECSECSAGMDEGFIIEGGEAYYCSTKCLNVNMSDQVYNDLYESGSETYYTEWEKEQEYEDYLNEFNEVKK